jgi:hypothetical protein
LIKCKTDEQQRRNTELLESNKLVIDEISFHAHKNATKII